MFAGNRMKWSESTSRGCPSTSRIDRDSRAGRFPVFSAPSVKIVKRRRLPLFFSILPSLFLSIFTITPLFGEIYYASRDNTPASGGLAKYPAVAKIVGRGDADPSDSQENYALFYGSGVYVAEVEDLGIVLTNWHVVSEARGNLNVRFGSFQSPGTVIMADTSWDIAAIAIYKPPFLPIPISLEVPQIGDELWVAGFGQTSDLDGFQLSSGPVIRYCCPDEKALLPGETIQIGTGIRHGDSGGPILNKYGELAGLLWGSDGYMALGTFCLRLQAFLTQAQYRLMSLQLTAPEFFAKSERGELHVKKIAMPSVPAQNALKSSGVYPISTRPVYSPPPRNQRLVKTLPGYYKPVVKTDIHIDKEEEVKASAEEASRIRKEYLANHRDGFYLPPYPAIESPTLMAQRNVIGRSHPEVYPTSAKKVTKADNRPSNRAPDVQPTGATVDPPNDGKRPPLKVAQNSPNRTPAQNSRNPRDFQKVALEENDPISDQLPATTADQEVDETSPEDGEKTSWINKIPGFPDISISNLQSIIAMVIVLFLFINSLRLLYIASERGK